MEILIRKIDKVFGAIKHDSVLTIGDMRDWLVNDFRKTVEDIVNDRSERGKNDPYWIWAYVKGCDDEDVLAAYPNALSTKVFVCPELPDAKWLGSMCFEVDPKKGVFKTEWILPLDKPEHSVEKEGVYDPLVAQSTAGMPYYFN